MTGELNSLSGLRCFLEVVSAGSFGEAARNMGLSPSAVSKAVNRLEDELGVRLLNRTTRSVALTLEGERLAEGAASPLKNLLEIAGELRDGVATPRGRLSVSVPAAWGRVWLLPRLAKFLSIYPEISLDVSLSDRAVALASEGVDLAVRTGAVADSLSVIAKHLFDDPILTVAHPDYIAARGLPASPDDLAKHDCLAHRTQFTGRLYPWRFTFVDGNVRDWPLEGRFICDDGEAVANSAASGTGISQMPFFLAENALAQNKLIEILGDFRPPPMIHTALALKRQQLPSRLRVLLDFISSEVQSWKLKSLVNRADRCGREQIY